ncbi:MAG TPA: ABC transporter ATP-binding protein [Xanthobacteraceae bacterium]|nr:ABC transporter ATP-binding protein [Xanthobacteraceae bacterium]
MASVELRGLTKRYGTNAVVDDISLKIGHGLLVCLLGPSGCGKTTTLRLLAGFVEPSAGEILVGDRVISSPSRTLPPEQRNMSMIFQSYALWPHMTVAENVAYGLRLRKMKSGAIKKRVQAMLATIKLEQLADRYPGELSGGQQQRVSLARALVVEPETLLLDEPLSNLDANLREEMRFEVRRLHDQYRYTTVYVTHDQSEAMTTADLIAVMNLGKIEQLGTPEQIYNTPRSEFVARFIGASNIVRGQRIDDNHIAFGGARLRCNSVLPGGSERSISIRQHDIQLSVSPLPREENVLAGDIVRQVFLGGHRDYIVTVEGGTQLRIITPADQIVAAGTKVWLHLPPTHCHVLAD